MDVTAVTPDDLSVPKTTSEQTLAPVSVTISPDTSMTTNTVLPSTDAVVVSSPQPTVTTPDTGFQKPIPPGKRGVRSRSSSEADKPASDNIQSTPAIITVDLAAAEHEPLRPSPSPSPEPVPVPVAVAVSVPATLSPSPTVPIQEHPLGVSVITTSAIPVMSPDISAKRITSLEPEMRRAASGPALSTMNNTDDSPLKASIKRASAIAHPLNTAPLFPEDDDVQGSPALPDMNLSTNTTIMSAPPAPSQPQQERSRSSVDGFVVIGPPVLDSLDHSLSVGLPPLPDFKPTTQTDIEKLILTNSEVMAQVRALHEANTHLNITVQRQQAINTGKGASESEYIWIGPTKPKQPSARVQTLPQLAAHCEHAESYLFMCESRIAAAELRASADDVVTQFLREQANMYAQLQHSRAEVTQVKTRLQQTQNECDELRKRISILLQEHLSAGHADIHLPPPDIERERKIDSLIRQVEDLSSQLADERSMRTQLQASLIDLQHVVWENSKSQPSTDV